MFIRALLDAHVETFVWGPHWQDPLPEPTWWRIWAGEQSEFWGYRFFPLPKSL